MAVREETAPIEVVAPFTERLIISSLVPLMQSVELFDTLALFVF